MTYDLLNPAAGTELSYQVLFDALPTSSLLLRADAPHYTILAATPQHFKYSGLKKEEVVGKGLFEAFPSNFDEPDDNGQGNLRASLNHVLNKKEPHELPVQRYDVADQQGHFVERYWRLENSPVFALDGTVTFIVHTTEDITEQAKAGQREEAHLELQNAYRTIEESEAKFRTLFESMDQGYCTLEIIFEGERCVDYRYLEANPTFERHLGVTGALGKTIREIAPDIEPKWFEFYGGVALTGKPIRIEEESKAFNKWFEVYAIRIGCPEERKVGVFFTDITQRKASELSLKDNQELLQAVFDAAPNSLTVYEEVYNEEGEIVDFKFVIVNEFTTRTTGRADLVGKCYSEEFPNVMESGVMEVFKDVATTGIAADFEKWYAGEGMRHWFRFIVNKVGKLLVVTTEDITNRKEGERKTGESEAKLRSILNSTPTAIGVFVGPDLIVENPNQLFIEVMAAGPDIEGKSFRKLLAGVVEEDQKFIALVDAVRTTGKAFEAQEVPVFFKAEKRTRHFNISFIPLLDKDGVIYAVLDVSVDVTEQVHARKKIEESEGRFRLLADASPNLIWMLKPDGSYGYVNKTALHFLGITQEQIGQVGWGPYLHPDDLEAATQAVTKAVETHQPYELEHRLRHKDGKYRWVLSQALPAFEANGDVFAYVGSSIDIDEAKKSREELLTALEQARLSKEAAQLGTFDLDLEAGTMHWDDRCRVLFGICHQNPVSYEEDFVEGLHPDDRDRITEVINQLLNKSIPSGDYDVEYRTIGAEDGVLRWVRAKGKVYFDLQEKPIRFIGSVLDITEQKTAIQKIESLVEERTKELAEANKSLLLINKELQRSNAHLEEFAHAASHDLKEPVRKIKTFTSQLKVQLTSQLAESGQRLFNRIEIAADRMGNLIDDLLLYSHVSHLPHEMEAVDLKQTIQHVLEDLELDVAEKGAIIHVGRLPVVRGYKRQLQQMFQNLISNALKYSKEDVPPQVKIDSELISQEDQVYQVIAVKDNGIGFEPEYADKIFQMFARLHGKSEYSGTGIGLSIVKKVIENHNGMIKVESVPGEGSVFKIFIPNE